MQNWIILIILGIQAGFGKGLRDTVAFNWHGSIFKNINNDKFRDWLQSTPPRPTHIIWFLWDGWHFGDSLSYTALLAAMFFVSSWLQIGICAALVGGVFQFLYHVGFRD